MKIHCIFMMFASQFLSFTWTNGQNSCPEKMDQMMMCLLKLKTTNLDYKTIIAKKPAAARSCGASEKNVRCWQMLNKCELDAERLTASNTVKQEAVNASIVCYNQFPNNIFVGMESIFDSMKPHQRSSCGGTTFGASNSQPQGPLQYKTPEPGDDVPDSDEQPIDCTPTNKALIKQCILEVMGHDQAVLEALRKLKPEMKSCEDMLPMECEPKENQLHDCLNSAFDSFKTFWATKFSDCMRNEGYSIQSMKHSIRFY